MSRTVERVMFYFVTFLLFFTVASGKKKLRLRDREIDHREIDHRRKMKEETYDWGSANCSVSLSALAYCGNQTIMSGNYSDSF